MATAKKTAQGTWRVQLEIKGVRDSGTFPTKREADAWAARRATEIRAMATTGQAGTVKTLRDALRRYADEVSPTKRGEVQEVVRLRALERQALPIDKKLADLTTADLVLWRDSRLAVTARGSVLRQMTLLGHVLEVARREWQWIGANPMADVRRPGEPDHRERIITGREVRLMLRSLGYTRRGPVRSMSQAVAMAFLLALSTGMRAGEIAGLTWDRVRGDHVRLPITKNGSARDVPLSTVARRVIGRMEGFDSVLVFGIGSQVLSTLFRRHRERAGLDGFTFHDARHTAATRLAMSRRVDVLELCRIMGWKNPKQAMVYFNPTASQIAARLG
jgi:integrase